MTQFRQREGTKSSVLQLKKPFPEIRAFTAVVRSFILKNPLGCTSYRSATKNHLPVLRVRELYTAKFVYENAAGKRVGSASEVYDSVEGYETGIAAVISNMANIASHHGKVKHLPAADLFSITLKCHDPNGEVYFLSIARDRMTLSSYSDDTIRLRAEAWADRVLGTRV
ncbi:MAG: hypothetical protein ABFC71_02340 [Methanoregula sp.]